MAGTVGSTGTISIFVNVAQALANLDKFQKSFDNGISRMRNMVVGFIGARGLKGYYDNLMSIIDLADRWHLPVEKVSAWTNLLSQFGGGTEEALSSFERLQSLANDLKFSSNGAFRELSAILNTNLQNKDYMGAVKALREGMKGLSNDAKTEVIRRLGFDSAAIQRMLEASDEEFAEALKSAQEFGVLNEESAQSLRDMRQTISDIKQLLLDIAIPFVKAIQPVLKVVRDVLKWFGGLSPDIKEFIAQLIVAFTILKQLVGSGRFLVSLLLGNGKLLAALGAIALFADVSYGIYQGIKKAREEGATLENILDAMASHSYALNISIKIGNKLGEWLSDFIDKVKQNAAASQLWASPNLEPGDRGKQLIHAKRWLDKHQNSSYYERTLKNYQIAQSQYNAELRRRAREMLGPPEWVGRQSPITNNDNRSMTFNIYGVDGASDLENRLRTLINNNVSPVTGWAK